MSHDDPKIDGAVREGVTQMSGGDRPFRKLADFLETLKSAGWSEGELQHVLSETLVEWSKQIGE